MRNVLNIFLPLAAAGALAAVALLNRPAAVMSAPPLAVRLPKESAKKPTTRPAGNTRRSSTDGERPKGYRGPMKLSVEQEKEVLAYLQEKRPEIYKEIVALKDSDPARYRRTIRSIYPFVARVRRLPPELAEAYEVLQKTHVALWKLAREYSAADSAERKKQLEQAMHDQAAQRFEAEQKVRRQRLDELKQQIANLQAELDQRAQDSDSVIQETVDQFKRHAARWGKRPSRNVGPESDRRPGKKSDRPEKKPGKKKAGESE